MRSTSERALGGGVRRDILGGKIHMVTLVHWNIEEMEEQRLLGLMSRLNRMGIRRTILLHGPGSSLNEQKRR